jgi:hypothetical protein
VRTVEFRRLLDETNALRVSFDIEHGQVQRFVVQLEGLFDDAWQAVVRYDTAHGFAHCDVLHPYDDTQKISLETNDYNEALTYAQVDLANHWRDYRARYEEWLKAK